MLSKIKSSIIPLTVVATLFISSSQVLAVDDFKQSTPPGQMRSCQVREAAIKTRMTHLTELVTKMIAKFDTHAQKVENFYTNNILPTGKKVSNYDSLVADISAKRATALAVLNKAQTDVNGFSCSNGHPKADMTQFRQDMQSVKQALKDERTSIKNLIVAVRGESK